MWPGGLREEQSPCVLGADEQFEIARWRWSARQRASGASQWRGGGGEIGDDGTVKLAHAVAGEDGDISSRRFGAGGIVGFNAGNGISGHQPITKILAVPGCHGSTITLGGPNAKEQERMPPVQENWNGGHRGGRDYSDARLAYCSFLAVSPRSRFGCEPTACRRPVVACHARCIASGVPKAIMGTASIYGSMTCVRQELLITHRRSGEGRTKVSILG